MDFKSLDGYCIGHVHDDGRSILREKRVIAGLTQQKVADKAKIALRQYQKFETGERSIRNASFDVACRVIEALRMDISAFFHGDYYVGEEIC